MLGAVKGGISRMISKGIVMIVSLVFLHACGGGGGGGSSKPTPVNPSSTAVTSSSVSSQAGPAVNAGPDQAVNAGARVDLSPSVSVVGANAFKASAGGLEISGASTTGTDIVKLVWVRTEGPSVAITTSDTTSGKFYFTAPETGTEATVKLVFELAVTNASGQTAKDTVAITVNRVNRAPAANAGTNIEAQGSSQVSLNGSASKDTDGTVTKYTWAQVGGEAVTLNDSAIATPSFTAPAVIVDTELEFELTVEDNDGATATDRVIVRLTPKDAPEVRLHFPPLTGAYSGSTISAFGSAKTIESTLAGVTVDAGNGPIAATVNQDNSWRVDNLALPVGGNEVVLKIEVTDSLGRKGRATSTLKTSTSGEIGSGPAWKDTVGVAVDPARNKAYVLATGSLLSDVKLFSIDLTTGNRSEAISSFSDLTQGINASALVSMAYDPELQRVYAATFPADTTVASQVLSIDAVTGARTLVSDNTKGTGPALQNPSSIQVDGTKLYVADNKASTILRIDALSGNREVIASATTVQYKIDAPLLLARDPASPANRLFMMPNALSNYVLALDLAANPVTSSLITNSAVSAQGPGIGLNPSSLVVDSTGGRLFAIDRFNDLFHIDMSSGQRKKLADLDGFTSKMDYDRERKVLVVTEGSWRGLWIVDPITGQQSVLSKK
jgi:LysM repeat protein